MSETETVVFSKIPIFVAIHLAFLQQMSGINSIITYSNKIIDKAYPDQADLLATLINFEQIFATLLTSFLLGKFGRKFILQSGTLFEAISLMIIAIGFLINSKEDGADNSFSNVMILFGLFLFMLIFGLSLGPVVWLYIPEIVQPSIIPYSTAANWIGALLTIFLFPIIAG